MSGYRFCRTDDVPLLVEAHNRCFAPYVDGAVEWTREDFKQRVRDLDLWASSCMVALAGSEPIAVLLAAKRERETLIYRIGVQSGHRRQGHGRHLLESLGRKLAILGPPRLVAEVREDDTDARRFFRACGYGEEQVFTNFSLRSPAPAVPGAGGLAGPVGLEELIESGAWCDATTRSWERSRETLVNRRERLEGFAVATDERVEAWALTLKSDDGSRDIAALGGAPDPRGRSALGLLVRTLAAGAGGRLSIPRVSDDEVEFAFLEAEGFVPTARWVRYAIVARADGV